MTEVNVDCPFCATAMPAGASVCRSCGANKGTRSGLTVPLLLVGAFWFFWGPLMCWFAFYESSPGTVPPGYGALFIGVTVAGAFVLRWIWRKMAQPVWRRRAT